MSIATPSIHSGLPPGPKGTLLDGNVRQFGSIRPNERFFALANSCVLPAAGWWDDHAPSATRSREGKQGELNRPTRVRGDPGPSDLPSAAGGSQSGFKATQKC